MCAAMCVARECRSIRRRFYVIASIVAVVLFGVWPAGVLDVAGRSAATLTQTAQPDMNSSRGETGTVDGKR